MRICGFAMLPAALLTLTTVGGLVLSLPLLLGYHPPKFQQRPVVCPAETALASRDHPLRVMSWNIQFLAGSYYPFWEDDFDQPPLTNKQIDRNLDRIVAVIRQVKPDILQLQEVHLSHPVSLHRNQLDMLREKLADEFPCYTYGSYWKARLVPKKHMFGTIDMALLTMSRFRISAASQEVLPATRKSWFLAPFYPRRSLLETQMPIDGDNTLTTINTHLDTPVLKGGDMTEQVSRVHQRAMELTKKNQWWVMTGDFNLVPPGFYQDMPKNQKELYSAHSPLQPFYENFTGIPALNDIASHRNRWLTAYDLNRDGLDLVLDYIFHPPYLTSSQSRVLPLPLDVSDHMPVITEITLPGT